MSYKQKLFSLTLSFAALFFALPAYSSSLTFVDKPVVNIFNDAAAWLLSIVGAIALAMLVYGGIRYIFSGGSPDSQNSAKKTITYAIVGLILIMASYAILAVISNVLTNETISITNAKVDPNSVSVGGTLTITAKITAVNGVDASTTKAHIQATDEVDVATVDLYDDGTHGDTLAGDNIYTGQWTATNSGCTNRII